MNDEYDVLSAEVHKLQDKIENAYYDRRITYFEYTELLRMVGGIIERKKIYGF